MSAGIDFDAALGWYDRNAEAYRASADLCDPAAEREIFLKDLAPGARILDAGCGTGRDLALFRAAGHRVTGLDPSAEMRRITRERLGLCLPLRGEPLQAFRDPEGSWDAIWAMASLLHIPMGQQEDVLARLYKSLAPGGRIYACWKAPSPDATPESIDSQGRPMTAVTISEASNLASRIAMGSGKVWLSRARASAGPITVWTNLLIEKP